MNNCKICCLYSGSKGNSTYIEVGNKKILIDAGKSARSLCSALSEISVNPDELDVILITHEHTDHISALATFSHSHNIPIHIMLESAKKFQGLRDEKLCRCLCIHDKPNFSLDLDGVKISAFPTPHDSRASVGYKITYEDTSIAYATDIGYVSDIIKDNLTGCDNVIIESNHDTEMLLFGPYPYELKERISSRYGHLSNRECASLSAHLASTGTKNIMLAHLSEENNTPQLAFNENLSAIGDQSFNLRVAMQNSPVWLVGGGKRVMYDDEFFKLWVKEG